MVRIWKYFITATNATTTTAFVITTTSRNSTTTTDHTGTAHTRPNIPSSNYNNLIKGNFIIVKHAVTTEQLQNYVP